MPDPWRSLGGKCDNFEGAVCLRRIYRQKRDDAFKDFSMRLRDAAITTEDYDIWKTHEINDVSLDAACHWPGGEQWLSLSVALAPESALAGKINGKQLVARAPLHGEPGSASSGHAAVRCEARRSQGRGAPLCRGLPDSEDRRCQRAPARSMTRRGRLGRATRRAKLGSLTPRGRCGSVALCVIGLVLAGLEALRAVKSGAATVETHKYCVPVEDFG